MDLAARLWWLNKKRNEKERSLKMSLRRRSILQTINVTKDCLNKMAIRQRL